MVTELIKHLEIKLVFLQQTCVSMPILMPYTINTVQSKVKRMPLHLTLNTEMCSMFILSSANILLP
jgi:hypothetical protein